MKVLEAGHTRFRSWLVLVTVLSLTAPATLAGGLALRSAGGANELATGPKAAASQRPKEGPLEPLDLSETQSARSGGTGRKLAVQTAIGKALSSAPDAKLGGSAAPGPPTSSEAEPSTLPISSNNVEFLANIPFRGAGLGGATGGRFRKYETPLGPRYYFYVTGAQGLVVIDATVPRVPLVVGMLPLPHFENEDVDFGGNTLLISADGTAGSALFVVDISVPTTPRLRGAYKFTSNPGKWGSLGGPGHIANCIADCRYAYVTGSGGGWVAIVDIGDPAQLVSAPVLVGAFRSPIASGSVHDVNVDPQGTVWLTGADGLSAYRVSGPGASPTSPVHIASFATTSAQNTFILHNSLRPNKIDGSAGEYVFVTEENWLHPNNSCSGAGRFEVYRYSASSISHVSNYSLTPASGLYTNGAGPLGLLCSAHWFDYRADRNMIAIGWYMQGVRFLDVSDPASVQQIGYWLAPDTTASAAYFHPQDRSIVYVADYSRGVDILRVCPERCPLGGGVGPAGSFSARPTPGLEYSAGRFGWSCAIVAPKVG